MEFIFNKKCKLSNIEIYFNKKCGNKKYKTATLDRIDSTLGYIKTNVQWVHRDINKLKSNFPESYLIKLCGRIYLNNTCDDLSIEDGVFYKKDQFQKVIC